MKKIVLGVALLLVSAIGIKGQSNLELTEQEKNILNVTELIATVNQMQYNHYSSLENIEKKEGKLESAEIIPNSSRVTTFIGDANHNKITYIKENNKINQIVFTNVEDNRAKNYKVRWSNNKIEWVNMNEVLNLKYDNKGLIIKAEKSSGYYTFNYDFKNKINRIEAYRAAKKDGKIKFYYLSKVKERNFEDSKYKTVTESYNKKKKKKASDKLRYRNDATVYEKGNILYVDLKQSDTKREFVAEIEYSNDGLLLRDSTQINHANKNKGKIVEKYSYNNEAMVVKKISIKENVRNQGENTIAETTYNYSSGKTETHTFIKWYNNNGDIIKERENKGRKYRIKQNGSSWGSWQRYTY